MKKVVIVVLVLLIGLAGVAYVMPSDFSLECSMAMKASPEKIHTLVGDLTQWKEWAPWHEEDPTIVTTFGDKTTGVGASQTWTSEQENGGKLEFTECDPKTGIAYKMAFLDDSGKETMPANCAMKYTSEGDETTITWTMAGDMGPFGGAMKFLIQPEIEKMFLHGLDTIKSKVEANG